jgi:hypothetical protein
MTYPSRNLLVGTAMVLLVPIVVAGAYLFSVSSSDSATQFVADVAAHHGRFLAGGLLLTAGSWLFVPASIGLLRLAPARGRTVVTVGAVVAGVSGVAVGAANLMQTVVFGALTPGHLGIAADVQRIADGSALVGLPYQFAPVLFLGLIVAAVGLLIGGFRPWWLPALLIVGAVVIFLFGDGEIGAIFHAPITVALAGFGVVLLRRSGAAEASRPEPAVAERV